MTAEERTAYLFARWDGLLRRLSNRVCDCGDHLKVDEIAEIEAALAERATPALEARLDEIARECSDVLDDVVERWQGTDAQIKAIIRRALDAALDAAREIPR